MVVSTIAIAEYCVKGPISDLPLQNVQLLTFNAIHALKAGEFAAIAYKAKKNKSALQQTERIVIPNDTKLMAQAECEKAAFYLTADGKSKAVYEAIGAEHKLLFQFADLNIPHQTLFGLLDL